jgi:tRNA(Ile)-lysidine synthase
MAAIKFCYNYFMDIINLRNTMQEECQLTEKMPVLVGVSGGPDSLCLLDILCRLEYRVKVAHFDHGLRPDSSQDAEKVRQQVEKRGLDCVIGKQDVLLFAKQERLSIEEAARMMRYQFLFDQARQLGAQVVAVAHNADDQVETVLMHLLRGSGLNGLKGMVYRAFMPEWDLDIPLVRPLLGVWRNEILAYCQEHHLDPAFDPSNQDTAYFRNRLRHELIPYLESYNPQARQVIWRMTRSLAADQEALAGLVQQAWAGCVMHKEDDFVSLSLPNLRNLDLSLQRRVFRKAIAVLRPGLSDIDFNSIERALQFMKAPTSTHQVDLVDNLRLYIEGEQIFIAEWGAELRDESWPQMAPASSIPLILPGNVKLCEEWRIECEVTSAPPSIVKLFHNTDLFQAWLDADKLANPLTIRTRLAGDRFQPLGMDGHSQKLSDFMVNAHLASRARAGWPLVCSRDQIAWIPGFQPSYAFRVTDLTERVAHLKVLRE